MKSKLLDEHAGERTFALVFETGDTVMEPLGVFLRANDVTAARFSGIGAFRSVTLGYFDWEAKDYERIPINEQVEVVSLAGDVALKDDEPQIHAHVVIAKRDGSAHGGHLLEGSVRPTLEVVLVDAPTHLRKRFDPQTGLALIAPEL
jgi:predicted DNA-binding protein with PD1-like motif